VGLALPVLRAAALAVTVAFPEPEAHPQPEADGVALTHGVTDADRVAVALTVGLEGTAVRRQIAGAARSDSSSGISAVTTVPRPGLDRRLKVPLASSTRSRIEARPTRPDRR